MPYRWTTPETLILWPHRALPATGFVTFIAVTAALISLPLLSQLGTSALWVLLPFLATAVAAIWFALRRNSRDRAILETLTLSPDQITLTRQGPHGQRHDWQANPYWAQVILHKTAGPVPNYLTLKGNGREVELGAFLTEAERVALHDLLLKRLSATTTAAPSP